MKRFSSLFAVAWMVFAISHGEVFPAPSQVPSREQRICTYFKRSESDVRLLRDNGFGYAEIVKILIIANESKKPLPDLLSMNQKGLGWGTIAQNVGLKPTAIKRKVDAARLKLNIHTRPNRAVPEK